MTQVQEKHAPNHLFLGIVFRYDSFPPDLQSNLIKIQRNALGRAQDPASIDGQRANPVYAPDFGTHFSYVKENNIRKHRSVATPLFSLRAHDYLYAYIFFKETWNPFEEKQ